MAKEGKQAALASLSKAPFVVLVFNDRGPIGARQAVEGANGKALPEPAYLGDRFDAACDAAEELGGAGAGKGSQLTVGDFIAGLNVVIEAAPAEGVFMKAVATDEGFDREKLCVAEEAYPQLEVACGAVLRAQRAARAIPQTPPPIR